MPRIKIFLDKGNNNNNNCQRRVLARTAKTRGCTLEVPAYREENCAVPEKISIFEKRFSKDCPKARKGLPTVCWGLNKHAKDSGSRVSPTRLFRSYGHFVMAYAYSYTEPYSTTDKERPESQKVFSVSVVESLENEIRFDINFTCKGRSRDRYILPVLYYKFNSYI